MDFKIPLMGSTFSPTKMSRLEKTIDLARVWLPPISLQDKSTVNNILMGTEITVGTLLLRKYIQLLRPYTEILGITNNSSHEADCVASGIVFFYGCLCYIMHFPHWGDHIEDIFLYNLLYILVDHYIDDMRIEGSIKNTAISQMGILIMNPLAYKTMTLVDPILKTIAVVYQRLITRCPNAKDTIIKLFRAEIEGLHIQKTATCSRKQYYDIALQKGGYTMEILQSIVGNTDLSLTFPSYQLGEIMQLLDDSVDVLADRKNGIHTIATHDLESKGCLDELWIDIIHKICAIDSRFTIFKMIYMIFAMYIPDRIPEAYSKELRSLTNPLNMFDYTDGSSLLVGAIMGELIAMDILDNII